MTESSKHTIIIAEVGVNHGGNFDLACRLVKLAAQAGADYVKFQTFKAENLVCADASRAEYQKRNCGGDETQLQMLKKLELKAGDFSRLADVCRSEGVGFLSSAFDSESIALLNAIGMDYWKIPSGEITNLPYLEQIAACRGKIILSTGMSVADEIAAAVAVLSAAGVPKSDIALLHCNTQYPTPPADVNLRAMETLRALRCGMTGYSDHTEGIAIPIAAVALGAEIIEKHFTYDKNAAGPDHRASADPAEFAAMVRGIRSTEAALGSPLKHVTDSERPNVAIARKSIVASRHIAKGELLTPENITTKRPGTGISPMRWHEVTGTRAVTDFLPDQQIIL